MHTASSTAATAPTDAEAAATANTEQKSIEHDLTGHDLPAPWFARQRPFAVFFLVTSLLCLAASLGLVAEKMALLADANHISSCDLNPWVSCGTVMKSAQASAFGFPNQFIGVIGYSAFAALAAAMLAGARFARWFWWGIFFGTAFAFAFCVWLFISAVWDIHALCLYCMLVWLCAIPMVIFTAARLYTTGHSPNPRWARAVSEWSWVVALLVMIVLIVVIAVEFAGVFFSG